MEADGLTITVADLFSDKGAAALLTRLREAKVNVSANDGRIALDGPDAALTDELVAEVREHKAELIAVLQQQARLLREGCTGSRPR